MPVIKMKNVKTNLGKVIAYVQNGEKTEHGILVNTINCIQGKVYQEMSKVKKTFNKEDGILAYHIIQSFKGHEVSPRRANDIGMNLVNQLFGDKYQAVVCTHVNKENVHNHIVINSVSMINGRKLNNSKSNIAMIKLKSDELCEEYGLSTITSEKALKEMETNKTRAFNDKNMILIKQDIDNAILQAKNTNDFKNILISRGYYIKSDKRKETYFLKAPYNNQMINIKRFFGDQYDSYAIYNRIHNHRINPHYEIEEKSIYVKAKKSPILSDKYLNHRFTNASAKLDLGLLMGNQNPLLIFLVILLQSILEAKMIEEQNKPKYEVNVIKIKAHKDKISDCQKKYNEIKEEINLVRKNNIKNFSELLEYQDRTKKNLNIMKNTRENLWKKDRQINDEGEKSKILDKIDEIAPKIKLDSKTIKIIDKIFKRAENAISEQAKEQEYKIEYQKLTKEQKMKLKREK